MYGAIYTITNTVNGKVYVGQTTMTPERRWVAHVSAARKTDTLLARAIRKHGREAFIVAEVEQCPDAETLNAAERAWIERLSCLVPAGYNLTTGGESANKHAPDVCRRKAASQRKRYEDPAQRERQGRNSSAFWNSPGARERVGAVQRARWSDEMRAAHGAKVKERGVSPRAHEAAARACAIAVVAVHATGIRRVFVSGKAAARALGICPMNISKGLRDGRPHVGFVFSRLEN